MILVSFATEKRLISYDPHEMMNCNCEKLLFGAMSRKYIEKIKTIKVTTAGAASLMGSEIHGLGAKIGLNDVADVEMFPPQHSL